MKVKLQYDEEYNEYYFQLFGSDSDYIWVTQLLNDNNNNKIAITEHGYIIIDRIDYENNVVYLRG